MQIISLQTKQLEQAGKTTAGKVDLPLKKSNLEAVTEPYSLIVFRIAARG